MLYNIGYNFALYISIASIAIDFVLAVASLLTGTSSANCAFAVDCFLDVISNAIMVWRFYGESVANDNRRYDYADARTKLTSSHQNYYQSLNQMNDKNNNPPQSSSHRKELIACIGLGIMFIVSGVLVMAKSGLDLAWADSVNDLQPDYNGLPGILHVTSVACVICSLLALLKYIAYKRMDSKAMYLESINSMVSAVLGLAIVVSTIIIEYDHSTWLLDPIVSMLFSVFMICYGIYNILKSQSKLNQYDNTKVEKKRKVEYIMIP